MDAERSAFCLRAGLNQVEETPFIDAWGDRVTMAYVPWMPRNLTGVPRMVRLADSALAEAVGPIRSSLGSQRVGLSISLPARFATSADGRELDARGKDLAMALAQSANRLIPVSRYAAIADGRAGGGLALEIARQFMESGEADVVIAGGVDSGYDWEVIEALERSDRLVTRDNVDGVVPGEAAAFLVLATPAACRQAGLFPVASAIGVAHGIEPVPIGSEEVCRAEGMTRALGHACSSLRAARRRSDFWFVDLTYELYDVREIQILIARFGDVLGANTLLQTPLRELGDVGAATVPLFCALAAEAWTAGFAPDDVGVFLAASERGTRAAAVLQRTPGR
jgi:hypothetical protein